MVWHRLLGEHTHCSTSMLARCVETPSAVANTTEFVVKTTAMVTTMMMIKKKAMEIANVHACVCVSSDYAKSTSHSLNRFQMNLNRWSHHLMCPGVAFHPVDVR